MDVAQSNCYSRYWTRLRDFQTFDDQISPNFTSNNQSLDQHSFTTRDDLYPSKPTTQQLFFSFFTLHHCYLSGAAVQTTVISFIYSFNFSPLLQQKVSLLLKKCRNASLHSSRGLAQTTMAVFWSFHSSYTFNIFARRFRFSFFLDCGTHFAEQKFTLCCGTLSIRLLKPNADVF